ncbi:MAG: nucleotidyl transferase AbiEii/AbiGii toxin family protein [Pilosibacter sp.]
MRRTIYIDEKDKQTVIFAYPHLFTNPATLQVIRLEIGALAAWTPAKIAQIEPYAAIYYPKVFAQKDTAILTVAPERTFWEKATILHHEANRPESSEMPQRYSRHYYDLYRMSMTPVKEAAFARVELLKTVVDFKMKFYPRAWAKYQEAVPGTLKLVPPEYRFAALAADYEAMKDMLYGDVPTFETVMSAVSELEKEINAL